MRKTIYVSEKNHDHLCDQLINRLQTHEDASKIGKADKHAYEGLAQHVRESLKRILEDPTYARLKSLENHISYHSLWTLLYQNQKKPYARKRMNRNVVELLVLFTFGELREDLLVEGQKVEEQEILSKGVGPENFPQQGFAYYEEFSFSKLKRSIAKANDEIKILDTFLDNWSRLRGLLKDATERNCKVRILLNDPKLTSIVNRSQAISVFGGTRESLEASIKNVQEEISTWPGKDLIKLLVHDCLPSFNLYGVDETYFIGLYWHKREAIEGPFMKAKNTSFKKFVNEHFESLWDYASQEEDKYVKNGQLDPILRTYIGQWHLYCNRVEKNEESFKLRFMEHGKVVENLLIAKEGEGELNIEFVTNNRGVFKGKGFICPSNSSFLEMRLTSETNKGTLYFLFHIGKGLENHLIGIYNHLYVNAPVLGTGLSALVRMNGKLSNEITLDNWNGTKVDEIDDPERQKIIRYLTFPSGTRIEAIQSFEQLKNFKRFELPSLFSGVYKIYAYQGSETDANSRFITESMLKINHRHQAFHKRYGPDYAVSNTFSYSEGRIQASKEDSLIISMKSKEHGRLGFFVINIGDYSPRTKHYYTGVFTGIALRSRRVAIGTRVILEYLGEDYELFDKTPITRYSIFSDKILEVPKEVRMNLMGRVNNMVGFLKTQGASSTKALEYEAKNGIDMKQVFFDSACQRALTDDVNEVAKAAKMFERAILHGYRPFEDFEEKLDEYEDQGLLSTRIKKAILENSIYRDILESIRGNNN